MMTSTNWDKFKLLLWKNWIIQTRHKVQTFFEIVLPVMFMSLLLLIRYLVDPDDVPNPIYYKGETVETLERFEWHDPNPPVDWAVAYTPPNPILEQLLKSALNEVQSTIPLRLFANDTVDELREHMMRDNTFVGVQFPDSYWNITKLPHDFEFSLRFPHELRTRYPATGGFSISNNWQTQNRFPLMLSEGPRYRGDNDGGIPCGYYREGFIPIQAAISRAFIKAMKAEGGFPDDGVPDLFLHRFPYPPYLDDVLLLGLESFIPLFMVVSFLYTAVNIVKYITVEKEKQLKEAMKIMGLPNWLHWTAWFIKSISFLIITISLIILILKLRFKADPIAVFTKSDWTVLWFFLFVYTITTTCFCFMLSVFFSKANTAALLSGIIWFLAYSPYAITANQFNSLANWVKWILCLFSNSAMAIGVRTAVRHEGSGYGLQWSNLFTPVSDDETFSVGYAMVMLLVDAVLYFLIALYVEKILPGDFGVPEVWYFPFKKSFWVEPSDVEDSVDIELCYKEEENFEQDLEDRRPGVTIRNLTKVYQQNKKPAVQNLNLNMYEDQITVLLGHNGAGKTTTMSMLTGMLPPTLGTILINGKNLRKNLVEVRNEYGLCPQHNVLFDELTVREHIEFFTKLKGKKGKAVEDDVQKYVSLLELQPKIDSTSKTLSGGMKRKLSVGIALCGGSSIILLDEPTSGMDPSARRALWDLLVKEKEGRTILLTTHFMDEADVLGDKIAIMAEGQLKCLGSPFFLKKRYGVGYRLVCVKGADCDTDGFTEMLSAHIPSIKVETDIGSELSYILNDEYQSKFSQILRDVEERATDFGVESYGVSLTTLEEVFLKVGSDSSVLDENRNDNKEDDPYQLLGNSGHELNGTNGFNGFNGTNDTNGTNHMNGYGSRSQLHQSPLLSGYRLITNQIFAMILKKYFYTLRNLKTFIIQLLIPVIFLAMTKFATTDWTNEIQALPPVRIQLNQYQLSYTVLQTDTFISGTPQSRFIRNYIDMFKVEEEQPIKHHLINTTEDFQEYLLGLGAVDQMEINWRYYAGAAITKHNITAFFNNQVYHSAPLTVNLLYNAILRSYCVDCNISVINRPLPVSFETKKQQLSMGASFGVELAFNTGFAYAFVAAFYILFYIKERVTRSKLLQFVSGVNIVTYWIVSFLWDYICFMVAVAMYLVTLILLQENGWTDFDEVTRLTTLMAVFAWVVLPMTYLFSFLFSVPSGGFTRMAMIYVLSGVMFYMLVFILESDLFDLLGVANTLNRLFFIFPHYSLIRTISNINIITQTQEICRATCAEIAGCTEELTCTFVPGCCDNKQFLSWDEPGSGFILFCMAMYGLLAFIILFLKEYRIFDRNRYTCRPFNADESRSDDIVIDSDVKLEKTKVHSLTEENTALFNLVLRDVTKFYGNFMAVNELCMAVESSECFGLLGVNGAGKTSTFKMLTGDENISSGHAWVQGVSLRSDMSRVNQMIGYCPQFDALLEDLTGRETLKIFALLRGVRGEHINHVTTQLAADLNFIKHLDKQAKAYSGGNKRKLSTAIALLGDPAVVYLDEPTSGMDPGARRQLWNVVSKTRKQGKSVILTSHSMEECEALCTRLAIMVNGEFKCLGSPQHLKSKFSKGFLLIIKVSRKDLEGNVVTCFFERKQRVKDFIAENFQQSQLKEEHSDMLSYHIQQTDLKWSHMFGLLEENRTDLFIEDYSLGQTSLEQVFLFFTKYQRE